MKIFCLAVVLSMGCANTEAQIKTDGLPGQVAALFVANPTPRWNGMNFKDRYHLCNATFVTSHLAVASNACLLRSQAGAESSVFVLDSIILENENIRFTVEAVFLLMKIVWFSSVPRRVATRSILLLIGKMFPLGNRYDWSAFRSTVFANLLR